MSVVSHTDPPPPIPADQKCQRLTATKSGRFTKRETTRTPNARRHPHHLYEPAAPARARPPIGGGSPPFSWRTTDTYRSPFVFHLRPLSRTVRHRQPLTLAYRPPLIGVQIALLGEQLTSLGDGLPLFLSLIGVQPTELSAIGCHCRRLALAAGANGFCLPIRCALRHNAALQM